MKKFRIFLILAVTVLINFSCEDDRDMAVLDNENAVASTVLTPANGSSYTLTVGEGANEFPITWSAPDYGAILPYYSNLELDLKDGKFTKPIKLNRTTGELTYMTTNAEMNLILYEAGITTKTDAFFRVVTTVKDPNVDTLISPEDKVSITPFIYNKANLSAPANGSSVVLKEVNSAKPFETFEWNAVDYGGPYTNKYTIELDLAGNDFKKAVVLGAVYTTSATYTVEAVNLALINLGVKPDVATSIDFRVVSTADGTRGVVKGENITLKLTAYSSEPIDPGTPEYPENLYVIGDASDAVWDAAAALPMTNDGDGKYSIITNLKADAGLEGYKFLVTQGSWEPMYGRAADGTWDAGSLVYRAVGDPDVPTIQIPPAAGSYLIELDLAEMTYKVTAQ